VNPVTELALFDPVEEVDDIEESWEPTRRDE
jgi:hypothetical protein